MTSTEIHLLTLSLTFGLPTLVFAGWTLLWCLARIIEPAHDPKEPPLASSRVPLLGHVWGLYKHGPKYFQQTLALTKAPIHSLNILNGKVYMISEPHVVKMVSRNSKAISFNPFIAEVGTRLTKPSDEARQIIERNVSGSQGTYSYVINVHDRTAAALNPGSEMDRMTDVTLREAWQRFLKPIDDEVRSTQVPFYHFTRHVLSVASTTALYGERNPFYANPKLEQDFWDFDAGTNMLIVDIYPEITARKAHKARTRIAEAFRQYFETDPTGNSSILTEARYKTAKEHGLSLIDMSRLETGILIGVLVNTVPTTFYLLSHIYSSPALLNDIRNEINEHAIRDGGNGKLTLNISRLRSHCVLLNSSMQETLRTSSEGASVRMVLEDTVIDDRFLLKKGGILQMPNSVIHRDRAVYGDLTFEPRRFMKDRQANKTNSKGNAMSGKATHTDTKDQKNERYGTTSTSSFRPFGGGSTLCPGKHFAAAEIMGLVAIIVWRFDVAPASGGEWVLPKPRQDSFVEGVFPPAHDIDVNIERRKDMDGLFARPWEIVFD